jgi:hypothetical protein
MFIINENINCCLFFDDGIVKRKEYHYFPRKASEVAGLYKFSRNPMYVGVMLMLIGETVFAGSVDVLVYRVCVFVAFQLFIVL